MYISVIGASECDEKTYQTAYEVGKLIAEKGAVLVCGGLGGVMDAAAKGTKEAGGISVGILPSEDRFQASSYLTLALPTGLGYARNSLVVLAGDAVIAISGEYGTLSEIGFALKYKKPLIALNTWDLRKKGKLLDDIIPAKTPEEAVRKAFELGRS